jgi:hypothetical protein
LPGPVLVMKKVMFGDCGGACCACTVPLKPSDMSAAEVNVDSRIAFFMAFLPMMMMARCRACEQNRLCSASADGARRRPHPSRQACYCAKQ